MIEEVKLVEWRRNVEARRAFGWAVVQQLLEEVDGQRRTVDRLRAEMAEKAADLRTRSALQIVELPADCPIWRGCTCEFLAPAPRLDDRVPTEAREVSREQAEQRAMGAMQR